MSTRRKYAADIAWEAVHEFALTWAGETGHYVAIVIVPGRGYRGRDLVEIQLRPDGLGREYPADVVVRGEFPASKPDRQAAVVLHLIAQAYQDLEASPWLWAPGRRALARGEGLANPGE